MYGFVDNWPINKVDPQGLLDTVTTSLNEAIATGNVAEIDAILDVSGDLLSDAAKGAAKAFLKKVAKCEAIHAAYSALNCKGCGSCSKDEAKANAACLTAEVAGRAAFLKSKCDYALAGSIAKGSALAEKGHQIQLVEKSTALAKCIAIIATLP